MAKKRIDVMNTSFRDGFQSVFGARVLTKDFLPAVEAAVEAGINHFEAGGGARFQSLYFYCNEDAFAMMDSFREAVGPDVILQTLARGINVVGLDSQSRDIIDLHAKLFKKHGISRIRNFDALNDPENLKYSAECIINNGLEHEMVVTMMDLPPGCYGAHDVAFYEKTLKSFLEAEIPYHRVCFKDASGTSNPDKVYKTIRMARELLPKGTHLRFHTHETAGVSVQCYMAALEAGADAIDLAMAPVSGGTAQPDILTMMHALKGTNFDLGFDINKLLRAEEVFKECMKDYFFPPEASAVSPLIPFSPMPGGALTANTQMMRDNDILDKFPEVINAMGEVVKRGGYGTSVTPVSQFYFQQAFNNVMFGPWKKMAEGYGKMVLGYFGKTPVKPDPDIVKIASELMSLEPTDRCPLDINDEDPEKGIESAKRKLRENQLDETEENIFITAACGEKGLIFLKGNASANVRKVSNKKASNTDKADGYTVTVDGSKYGVTLDGNTAVVNGKKYNIDIMEGLDPSHASPVSAGSAATKDAVSVNAPMPGQVLKIKVKIGDFVRTGDILVIIEAMKMETEIKAQSDGTVSSISVNAGDSVKPGQALVWLN
ncbi:MAG: biotin/lipoyl-binding protein [bacterium]|nr:biotin/lipoyl-binding protein [bacterium]